MVEVLTCILVFYTLVSYVPPLEIRAALFWRSWANLGIVACISRTQILAGPRPTILLIRCAETQIMNSIT